jgi:hypothetical protein
MHHIIELATELSLLGLYTGRPQDGFFSHTTSEKYSPDHRNHRPPGSIIFLTRSIAKKPNHPDTDQSRVHASTRKAKISCQEPSMILRTSAASREFDGSKVKILIQRDQGIGRYCPSRLEYSDDSCLSVSSSRRSLVALVPISSPPVYHLGHDGKILLAHCFDSRSGRTQLVFHLSCSAEKILVAPILLVDMVQATLYYKGRNLTSSMAISATDSHKLFPAKSIFV